MPDGDITDLVERALGEPAVEQSVLDAELQPIIEKDLQDQLDLELEDTTGQENADYLTQLLGAAAQTDASINDTTLERLQRLDQQFTEVSDRLGGSSDYPEAMEIDEDVSIGSYYVRKKPPYFFRHETESVVGNAKNGVHADPFNGRLLCFSKGGGSGGKGYASCVAGVGLYYAPPVRYGRLIIGSSPGVWAEGLALSNFSYSEFKTWIGIKVYKFTAGSNRYLGLAGDIGRFVCIDHSNFLGSKCHKQYPSRYIELSLPVDTSHWYAIFVWTYTRAGGQGKGFLWYGAGIAEIRAKVPWIDLAIS